MQLFSMAGEYATPSKPTQMQWIAMTGTSGLPPVRMHARTVGFPQPAWRALEIAAAKAV